ncbi:MAG TPA: YidC/Oxa1 family membrane protein insertase [Limnochordia bacterium]|nr:YidC/Oxa1 family membrane protein insertase [Limnochordia bacterium]
MEDLALGAIMDWLAGGLGWVLDQLVQLTGSYGLSIILSTVIVRLLLYPLMLSQTKSMVAMRKLQPELEKLQKKYGNDKEKYQQKMMELYQEHKINPLGGCLPMLVQLPILFAFLRVLNNSNFGEGAKFLGLWVLNQPDPYYILPILAAVTTYIQSRMTMTDQSQKAMLVIMPIMIGIFSLSFPAGMVLYWVTSNVFGIVQQAWMNKLYPVE